MAHPFSLERGIAFTGNRNIGSALYRDDEAARSRPDDRHGSRRIGRPEAKAASNDSIHDWNLLMIAYEFERELS
jgi:hypothetical protein